MGRAVAAKQAKAEADKAVSSAEGAVKNTPEDKKEELEKALKDAKSKQEDTEKESKKAEDAEKETKTYELTHDGKPDKLIKRKKLRGEGHVWCWASDKKQQSHLIRPVKCLKKLISKKDCHSLIG